METITNKGILILTPFFSPNIGGVESHLDDLVAKLDSLNYQVYVQTYSPITTPNTNWHPKETIGRNIIIWRYFWLGKNLFHKIEKYPLFDFIYLTPYLLIRSFWWMLFNHKKINTIHAQGLNASLIGYILKNIFKKKLVTSIHAIYEISPKSLTSKLTKNILNKSDEILTLSQASYKELISFGVDQNKLHVYKYWIQTKKFYQIDRTKTRQKLGFENKFTVLFVGRLIKKKGIRLLSKVAHKLPEINFVFIGSGPEEKFLDTQKKYRNIKFLGKIPNDLLLDYYNSADIFCIPSLYEEGFGRVVMEAVACGLPVIGSNKGGIAEALDKTVSMLIDPTLNNLKTGIYGLYKDHNLYNQLSSQTLTFTKQNFSDQNIKLITKYY